MRKSRLGTFFRKRFGRPDAPWRFVPFLARPVSPEAVRYPPARLPDAIRADGMRVLTQRRAGAGGGKETQGVLLSGTPVALFGSARFAALANGAFSRPVASSFLPTVRAVHLPYGADGEKVSGRTAVVAFGEQ